VRPDSGRYQVIPRVLVFLRSGDRVLLLRGAPDKRIWPGLLNGVGGHVEAGEDPPAAARRELREECGLDLETSALSLAAVITIDLGAASPGVLLFVFVAAVAEQPVVASAEGTPEWHAIADLAALPLVPDLTWLVPRLWDPDRGSRVLFARYRYNAAGEIEIHGG
jgi:8-oxo-dGTP diphosphatase